MAKKDRNTTFKESLTDEHAKMFEALQDHLPPDIARIVTEYGNLIRITVPHGSRKGWYEEGMLDNNHWKQGEWITYTRNGDIKFKAWYRNGILHRDGNPAVTIYRLDGKKQQEAWYENGRKIRDKYYNDKEW